METFILENKDILEKMARGQFSGHVSHEFRALFEQSAKAKGHHAHINWNCNCKSVENAAKAILR